MEAAAANGQECGLLALDWRKAFNDIDIATLGDTLDIAKVPNWARLPLMDMYKRETPESGNSDRPHMETDLQCNGRVWYSGVRAGGVYKTMGNHGRTHPTPAQTAVRRRLDSMEYW